ncbi:MAG: hypothetical protein QOH96_747 [Blastocatellia bacterium]|nr:hypothetical protein [Blastocatellia bacterium]
MKSRGQRIEARGQKRKEVSCLDASDGSQAFRIG